MDRLKKDTEKGHNRNSYISLSKFFDMDESPTKIVI